MVFAAVLTITSVAHSAEQPVGKEKKGTVAKSANAPTAAGKSIASESFADRKTISNQFWC